MVSKLTKEDILNKIRSSETAIISMNNGTMTTRIVSILFYDQKIWFQTDLRSKKMSGISTFDKCECSLLIDGINIDGGILETKGHPLDKNNEEWLKEFEKKHTNTVKMYSNIESEVLCCVDINFADEIRMWEYDDKHFPYIHTVKINHKGKWESRILDGYTYTERNFQ